MKPQVSVMDIFKLGIDLTTAIHGDLDREAMDCALCKDMSTQLAEWAGAHDVMVPVPEGVSEDGAR